MGLLDGKASLITGGASGIGHGTALRFAQEGARVVIADLQDAAGESVRKEIVDAGGQAEYVHCDVTSEEDVARAVSRVKDAYGRLDIVHVNAGINGTWAPLDELTLAEWNRTLTTNLTSSFLTLHHAIPLLREAGGGSVILTSSVNGTRSFSMPGASAYSTSKAAQIALMKTAALELVRHRIRVNAICPGAIETNINATTEFRGAEKVYHSVPHDRSAFHGLVPGQPADIADVCLFLASDLSRHISGVEIYVDCGWSLLR